jgi:adenosylhomocysteine nucleosidase
MEGAAVAQVCDDYEIPLTVIRVISDNANEEAHISAIGFVNQHAGEYSLSILDQYIQIISST